MKCNAMLISMLFMVLMAVGVLAQDANLEVEVLPGISPDNPLYGLDTALDNLRVALTAPGIEKARVRLEIAQERVAEVEKMAKLNKLKEASIAQAEEQKQIAEVEKIKDTLDADKKAELQAKLYKHILVLQRVREKVPEQARSGIDNALTNSRKSFDRLQASLPEALRKSPENLTLEITTGKVRIVREKTNV